MLLVLALMALVWWGGAALGARLWQRQLGVGAVVGAAIAINRLLPEGNGLREITGKHWELWFIVLLFGVVAVGYGYLLKFLRREAVVIEVAQEKRDAERAAQAARFNARRAVPSESSEPEAVSKEEQADTSRLTPDELNRYARHIVLREIGGPGQKKLKAAHVLVIGAGGLGSPALLYLAAAGVGRVTVVDDDTVEVSNLQRQVIHRTDGQGRGKAQSAAQAMVALNPHVKVTALTTRLTHENGPELVAPVDMILDGTDNFATRYLANELAVAARIPLISGALSQWEGQLSVFDPASGAPCYRCIFPEPPAEGLAPSCAEAGVMGPLPGVVGAMMAAETVKLITGAGSPLRGEMLIYDALWSETRKISLKRREDCATCGPREDVSKDG
ncbi:HesA/MoeB/ThiF family protein [Oceanicola sp. D3]|uniref:HesA/MoeB/ThiF family protein n=1 Tax=Oceanicola sp. D3 TaxID=2587163 RepID=UPI001121F145|nr:HesA/MoeB/ThiF family protein [Oceanicola sp. D3]QDC08265.1 HesA/MoeB/ThiF family protein [Oceanicola sp. D3]